MARIEIKSEPLFIKEYEELEDTKTYFEDQINYIKQSHPEIDKIYITITAE